LDYKIYKSVDNTITSENSDLRNMWPQKSIAW